MVTQFTTKATLYFHGESTVFLIHSVGWTGYRYVKASFYQFPPPPAMLLWGQTLTRKEKKAHHKTILFTHIHTC